MRKTILLSVAILVCGALAIAQETPSGGQAGSQSSTTQTTTTQTSSGNAIEGCLTGTSGNYVLTDAMGVAYKLQGDETQFADNVNKEVEVMGTASSAGKNAENKASDAASEATEHPGEAAEDAGKSAASGAGAAAGTVTGHGAKTLEVSSVRKIGETCGTGK